MSEENVSLPVAQALASALAKIEAYVPTEYVDNSEPDIDAEHLNHAEQGIMRVTNLLNAAVDVIQGQESRLADAETKIGTAALTGGMTDLSSGVNSLYSDLALRAPYLTATNNGKLLETIKNIHNAFDLSVPTIIKTTGSGVRCCIGYNYGKASSYGAYLWFDVFFTCSFVVCSNGEWHNYTLTKTEST